jgi:hypothetical protein
LAYLRQTDAVVLTALLSFYATLTVNTYYSIETFASITPQSNIAQHIVDTCLFFIYLCLGYSVYDPLLFWSLAVLLFVTASIKYFHLGSLVNRPNLIRKKASLDLLGAGLVASALAATVFLNVTGSACLTATIFAIANVYLLYIKPMYGRIDSCLSSL